MFSEINHIEQISLFGPARHEVEKPRDYEDTQGRSSLVKDMLNSRINISKAKIRN